MKKLYLIISMCLYYANSFAQKQDTIIIAIDTINIYGKVMNNNGAAIPGASIVTNSPNYGYFNTSTRSDEQGYFKLEGINPNSKFWIYSEMGNHYFTNNGSRYLFIKVSSSINQLSATSFNLAITAKKINNKAKIQIKPVISQNSSSFIQYESPATYPHGAAKFYQYLQENVVYPTAAIENAIEGNVTIEFTVGKDGFIKEAKLVKDIGYGCGEELIKVIKQSKKWNVAMQDGESITTQFSIEVPFKLTD